MNLYEIRMCDPTVSIFYVVAVNESEAARLAEQTWLRWEYSTSMGKVVSTKLVAANTQYPPKGVSWLLSAATLTSQQPIGGGE